MSQLVPVEGSNKYLVWDFSPVCHLNTIPRWSTTVKRSTLWRTRKKRPLRRTARSRTTDKLASLRRMSTCHSSSLSRSPSSSSSATWSYRWQKKLFELIHQSEIRFKYIPMAWEREARGLTCKQPDVIFRRPQKLVFLIYLFLKRIRGDRKYSTDMFSINFRNKGWKRTIRSWRIICPKVR